MTEIRLRPHHLLCILTYRGYGYGEEFVANFTSLVARIKQGAAIRICQGPDDVCAPLCQSKNRDDFHCDEQSTINRDNQAYQDLLPIFGKGVMGGRESFVIKEQTIAQLRQSFSQGHIRNACATCQWNNFCTDIAAQGFDNVYL